MNGVFRSAMRVIIKFALLTFVVVLVIGFYLATLVISIMSKSDLGSSMIIATVINLVLIGLAVYLYGLYSEGLYTELDSLKLELQAAEKRIEQAEAKARQAESALATEKTAFNEEELLRIAAEASLARLEVELGTEREDHKTSLKKLVLIQSILSLIAAGSEAKLAIAYSLTAQLSHEDEGFAKIILAILNLMTTDTVAE